MKTRKFSFTLLLIAACVFMTGRVAFGQSTATLQGTVTDQKGAVVPNATITVRNQATSIERTAQTDSSGNYQVAALPVGTYSVVVQAQGFKSAAVSDLNVEVARTLVKDFQLEVGSLEQRVNITADTPVIETATTSVGQVIDRKSVV